MLGIELEAKKLYSITKTKQKTVKRRRRRSLTQRVVNKSVKQAAILRRIDEFQNGVLVFTLNESVYLFTFRYTSNGIQDFCFLA